MMSSKVVVPDVGDVEVGVGAVFPALVHGADGEVDTVP